MEDRQRNNNGIRITTRELYDALRSLESKIADLVSQRDRVNDHEARLRSLETRGVGIATGAVGAVLAGIGVVVWRALS